MTEPVPARVTELLDALTSSVEEARAMPLSASCVVNRGEVLGMLEDLRRALPGAVAEAERVVREREAVVEEGRARAAELVATAEEERARRVSKEAVVVSAKREAARLLDEARLGADAMRDEVEDYVDSKLANFEVVLTKTLQAVERGREKLQGRSAVDDLPVGDGDRGVVEGYLETGQGRRALPGAGDPEGAVR
ncbi:MAG: hypothetical protein M3P93_01770 [Actinomycetota bacterium]|nr:hypothetical protein [Actinomycetota bacterium]